MLNLQPVALSEQPTSHVKIGVSKVGNNTNVVKVKHNNRSGYFYVDSVDDRLIDDIGNDIRVHKNIKNLFDGFDRGSEFLVDADVNPAEIPECKSISIYTNSDNDRVESYLKSSQYLVHPIWEVPDDQNISKFKPTEIEPKGYNTVRITNDTEVDFVDKAEFKETNSSIEPQSDIDKSSSNIGERSRQNENDDVDVSIEPKKPTVSFEEDVAGLPEVKKNAESLLALFDPEIRNEVIERYGDEFASRGNSMMLYGPPGCGKTLISEAIAYEAKYNTNIEDNYGEVKFLEIKGSDVLSKYSGESEKRVEAIFEKAHQVAQNGFAVLFFDEVDTLIPDRGDDSLQRHERSLTNAFLQEMNEIEDNLLVIGATNMPFTIDPAATRRFPTQIFIPQPDKEVMAEVWEKSLSGMDTASDIDYERLGAASEGYTPAEIADRVMGSELQRELIESVYSNTKNPIQPTTEFFIEKLDEEDPKTIRQYITSVRSKIEDLEGYPELRDYVENQADRLGMPLHNQGNSIEGFLNPNQKEKENVDSKNNTNSED